MNVYLVMDESWSHYEGSYGEMIGIFSSMELAKTAVKKLIADLNTWEYNGHPNYITWTLHYHSEDGRAISIEEVFLDEIKSSDE